MARQDRNVGGCSGESRLELDELATAADLDPRQRPQDPFCADALEQLIVANLQDAISFQEVSLHSRRTLQSTFPHRYGWGPSR